MVVVGLPTDLHGKELATITPRAKKFANRLHGMFGVQVELHDERLSTQKRAPSSFLWVATRPYLRAM
ncbi:Holliday junction resolvase yggF [Vibrio ishigakensis]|uniref:Holliday junction resolvase yggF n=1 Tax=Vibrio ishigakensis TaxID=1481914 RepID=A0A0B8P420_9VIBR|nr:Holliday junction resolvase yggF [Vibrio ishigakensis]